MGKKKKYKPIKQAVEQLPVLMRSSIERHYRTGAAMIADNRDDQVYDPVKVYVDSFPVQIAVNHKRKLKKLVNQFGPDVIPVYQEAITESK